MKKFILALMIALLPTVALAQKAPKTPESKVYDFEITRIIDGDTVAFRADFLPAPLKQELSVRVYGVDTPEKGWRGQCDKEKQLGEAASKFTTKMIKEAKKVQVAIMRWDKFGGRVIGDIIIDGKSLTKMLIENGYAREYYGDKKVSWCD
jgi:endonuclease YncB( thermonuclease family)